MKPVKLVLLSVLTLILTCSLPPLTIAKSSPKAASAAAAPTSLSWCNDLHAGLNMARSARRWVLLDCFTDSCHWCKKLDADTFSDPNVARTLGNYFVWVKCNTDDPSTGQWVKDRYSPQGYPCILILDPAGTEKGRLLGYYPPAVFVNKVAQIVRK